MALFHAEFPTHFPSQYCKDLNATFEKVALEDRIDDLATKPTEVEEESRDDDDDDGYPYDEFTDDDSRADTFPPKTILLQKSQKPPASPPTIGFVTLCYDERREKLVPMMEVRADGSRSKTGRRIDMSMVTPDSFPTLAMASSPTHSAGTISTLSAPEGFVVTDDDDDDSSYEPCILGGEMHMYLMHESSDPHHFQTVGCGDAFQKMMKDKMGQMRRKRRAKRQNTKSKRVAYRPIHAV